MPRRLSAEIETVRVHHEHDTALECGAQRDMDTEEQLDQVEDSMIAQALSDDGVIDGGEWQRISQVRRARKLAHAHGRAMHDLSLDMNRAINGAYCEMASGRPVRLARDRDDAEAVA